MKTLLKEIRSCQICKEYLPNPPNPVIHVSPKSRIFIIGQAPGTKVHQSGIPWDDRSGETLRKWMDIDKDDFYNKDIFGIMPMGFCYPGRGKSGDLPPRKECAPQWHHQVFDQLHQPPELHILIGQYANKYYLKKKNKKNLTETVRNFEEYLPNFLPLPHPSPRNGYWVIKNPWFEIEVLPVLRSIVAKVLSE